MSRLKFINKVDRLFYKLDRENAWMDQNRRCYYCGKFLERHEITADHQKPLANVKFHNSNNVVAACTNCNSNKGCDEKWEYVPTPDEILLNQIFKRLEDRTRLAEFRLSFDAKGGYKKWLKYHQKRNRWSEENV